MNQTDVEIKETIYSNMNILSFSMYQVVWTIIVSALNLTYFYFYHIKVGLDPIFIFLAMAIFTVWDSINEPLIGFLVDRNLKWTKKYGRRFPWVVIFIIPWCLSLYLIYTPPNVDATTNPLPVFGWLIMSFFIFDTFVTILDVNISTLRADKFRSDAQRRRYSKFFAPIDMIAMALGTLLPPMFLLLGDTLDSYVLMAAIIVIIGIVCGILLLPGVREDKNIIDRYYSREYERMSFFTGMKEVVKLKSFMVFYASYTTFGVATTLMTAMGLYLMTFVLNLGEDMFMVLMATFLIGAMISVIIWHKYLKKINNTKRVYTIGGFILCAALIPLTFFVTIFDLIIFFFIAGLAMGCIWSLGIPVVLSDVQDDYVVRTEKNQKGMLLGTWALIGRFTSFFDELIILIVFTLTMFPTGVESLQDLIVLGADIALIQWGLRFLIGVIPMCILLIGVLVFWKYYPLDPDKVTQNKAKLEELGF